MKVKDFIENLSKHNPNAEVKIYVKESPHKYKKVSVHCFASVSEETLEIIVSHDQ